MKRLGPHEELREKEEKKVFEKISFHLSVTNGRHSFTLTLLLFLSAGDKTFYIEKHMY